MNNRNEVGTLGRWCRGIARGTHGDVDGLFLASSGRAVLGGL